MQPADRISSYPSLTALEEGTILLIDKPAGWTSFDGQTLQCPEGYEEID